MAKIKDIKKAISTLGTAKKAVVDVLGDMGAVGFMPIEAELNRQLGRAQADEVYEGLDPEAAEALKAETVQKETEKMVEEANAELAKFMEARSPKKATPEPTPEPEPDEEDEPPAEPVAE